MTIPSKQRSQSDITYRPVTRERLDDLNRFSLAHGKFRYCSCMRWRLRSAAFQRSSKQDRVARLKQFVQDNIPVGVLAFDGNEPIGWCSVAPRETYDALQVSRKLPALDATPVWSVVCFFIAPRYRGRKLSSGLLDAAVHYAISQGAAAVEGYPVPPDSVSYRFMGVPEVFFEAGFVDVTPSDQERMVVRYVPQDGA